MDDVLYEEMHRTEDRHWWFLGRRRIIRALIRRYAGAPARRLEVCEIGCGTGGNIAALADEHEVLGVECSPHALRHARGRLGGCAVRGSLPDDLPFAPDAFDVVLLPDVLEHIEDDAASARAALSLVRPGGVLIATVPAFGWLYSPRDAAHHHFRRYGKGQFRRLFDAPTARVELLSFYNTMLFPPAVLVRLWSKFAPPEGGQGDLAVPPGPVNSFLTWLFSAERHLLGRVPLPAGLSLVAVVRKTAPVRRTLVQGRAGRTCSPAGAGPTRTSLLKALTREER